MGEILFDEMGLEGGKKGKTGAYATGADVLEDLATEHDLPGRVLDWRQLAKLKSTYTDALQDHINPDTGRVHTSYSIAGASRDAWPRPIRTCKTSRSAPKKGAAFARPLSPRGQDVCCARLLPDRTAHPGPYRRYSALKQAFRDGHDIHAMTASEMFDVPLDEMTPDIRRQAKGDQLWRHLRHFRLWSGAQSAHPTRRGARVYRPLFRTLPRHPHLHG